MKFPTLLLLIVFLFACHDAFAQAERDSIVLKVSDLDFSKAQDEIEVCISAEDFVDVWSLSFTLDWNAGVFEFSEVSYMNPLVVISLNEDFAPQGRLPGLWYDPRVEGVTLDVQNRLMCLKFNVLRQPCNGETIKMVDKPTGISITDESLELPKKLVAGQVINASCN